MVRMYVLLCLSSVWGGCLLVDAVAGSESSTDGGAAIDASTGATADASLQDAPAADAGVADAYTDPCALACPNAVAGRTTVCGQLYDVETDQPLRVASPTGAMCGAGLSTGPCALQIRAFDGLIYLQDPAGAKALVTNSITINDCGKFALGNVPTPALGLMALETQDAAATGADDYAPAASTFAAGNGERVTDRRLFALRNSTDAGWTTSAGEPFGSGITFSQKGAYMPVFVGPDGAAGLVAYAGVSFAPVSASGSESYFHFSPFATSRASLTAGAAVTGVNGTAVITDTALANHTGTGGEPADCRWPIALASTAPGTVIIQDWHAEATSGGPCP